MSVASIGSLSSRDRTLATLGDPAFAGVRALADALDLPEATLACLDRLAAAGRPFLLDGPHGSGIAFAAVLPRVAATRRDGVPEGAARAFAVPAIGPRAGDVERYAIGGIALGPLARDATLAYMRRAVALPEAPPAPPLSAGIPYADALVRLPDEGPLYGLSAADAAMAAARPWLDPVLPKPDAACLSMPWAAAMDIAGDGGRWLMVESGGETFRLAELPKGTAPRMGALAAGATVSLPPGSAVLARGYAEYLFKPMARALCEAWEAEAARVMAGFAGRLDPALVSALCPHGLPLAGYRWLKSSPSPRALGDRIQALGAFPLIGWIDPGPGIDAAVDGRLPPLPVLAARLGTSQACAKALRGLSLPEIGGRDTLAALPALADVEPRHLPAPGGGRPRGEQWRALAATASDWRRLLGGRAGSAPDAGLRAVLKAETPLWQRRPQGEGPASRIAEIEDYLDAAVRHLVLPVALDIAGAPTSALERVVAAAIGRHSAAPPLPPARPFLEGRTLPQVRAASRTWHGAVVEIEAELRLGPGPRARLRWHPLSAPYAVPGGPYEVVPLSNAEDLAAEGRSMRHCVASYVTRCMYGGGHVVSVRRAGERLSTARLEIVGPASSPCAVVEHKAARNAPAPAEARAALAAYVAALASGEHPRNPLAASPPEEDVGVPGLEAVGYDPAAPGARDLAVRLYAFALPEADRGLTHAEWSKRYGLLEALRPLVRGAMAEALADPSRGQALARDAERTDQAGFEAMCARLGLARDTGRKRELPPGL